MVSIRHGRRLAGLVAAATGIALLTLAAPASALTVAVPTLPAPLPTLPLPTGASVSGGTGGAPIDVSVTGPGSTAIDLQLAGIPALPTGPTGPVTAPVRAFDARARPGIAGAGRIVTRRRFEPGGCGP